MGYIQYGYCVEFGVSATNVNGLHYMFVVLVYYLLFISSVIPANYLLTVSHIAYAMGGSMLRTVCYLHGFIMVCQS